MVDFFKSWFLIRIACFLFTTVGGR